MKFILKIGLHIALSATAIVLVSMYVPGIEISGFKAALTAVFALFAIRYTVKPILMIISLPINLITLGLFSFVINGILFWLVAKYVDGFNVSGILAGIIGAFVVSVIKTLGSKLIDIIL